MYKNLLFSERLKQLRKERAYTQSELADRLRISCLTYSNYERGKSAPGAETVFSLCDIFGVSADYLLGLSNSRHSQYEEAKSLTGLSESSIHALKALSECRTSGTGMLPMIDMLIGSDAYIPGINYPDDSDLEPICYRDENNEIITPDMLSTSTLIGNIEQEWYENDHPFIADCNLSFNMDFSTAPSPEISNSVKKPLTCAVHRQKRQAPSTGLLNCIYRFLIFNGDYSTFGCGHEIPLSDHHPIHIGAKGLFIDFPSKKADAFCEYALEREVITALRKFKRAYRKQISTKDA